MKMLVFLSTILVLAPLTALAQTQPQGPPPDVRANVERIHAQARTQMLGALSPAHRALLGSVVAELATAPTPDVRAAAARLDAALSPNEAQAILAAENAARTQMQAQFGAMRGGPQMPGGTAPAPDAGRSLLHAAMAVGRPFDGGHRP